MSKITLDPQVLLLMMGHPGAGKSTMSLLLSKRISIMHINSDSIRESMLGSDRESENYKKILSPGSYEAMYRLAKDNLLAGNSVNIEVPHRGLTHEPNSQRFRVYQVISETNSLLKIAFTQFREQDLDELRSRMQKRMAKESATRDQYKLDNWDNYVKRDILSFVPDQVYFSNVLVLNATDNTEDNVERILDYLVSSLSCRITDTSFNLEARLSDYAINYLNRPEFVPYLTS